jgi:hypothetical protein
MQRSATLFVALALLANTPAVAQSVNQGSLRNLAVEIAYDFCPSFLGSRRPIASDVFLKERGFGPNTNAFGTFPGYESVVLSKGPDRIVVGGYIMTQCDVSVSGPSAATVANDWEVQLKRTGLNFVFDSDNSRSALLPNTSIWKASGKNGRKIIVSIELLPGGNPGSGREARFQMSIED